jgi:hypothetical protein
MARAVMSERVIITVIVPLVVTVIVPLVVTVIAPLVVTVPVGDSLRVCRRDRG